MNGTVLYVIVYNNVRRVAQQKPPVDPISSVHLMKPVAIIRYAAHKIKAAVMGSAVHRMKFVVIMCVV